MCARVSLPFLQRYGQDGGVLSSRWGTDIAPPLSLPSPSQRHGAKGEPLTQLFWDAHAEAANTTKQLAASNSDPYDLSHVTFARVDYINVTEITSRWMIWKCVLLSLSYLVHSFFLSKG